MEFAEAGPASILRMSPMASWSSSIISFMGLVLSRSGHQEGRTKEGGTDQVRDIAEVFHALIMPVLLFRFNGTQVLFFLGFSC